MKESRADAQLVADHLAGDRTALAGIYDRYADTLYDTASAMLSDRHEAADVMQDVFLIAAERLDQLRDQSRLKPWLFAILRNQVFTRTKRRGRTRVTDFSAPEAPEMAAPIDPRAEGEELAYTELAELVRSAAAGLDERDQLVLEYSVRQGLSGPDLADALGISVDQSYVVVHRMRERVERSLGAFTVARGGRKDCPDLASILSGWDGTFNVLIRKRVARHIEDCSTCSQTKRKLAVLPMLGAAPALAAPPDLRERVLARVEQAGTLPSFDYGFTQPGGFPAPVRPKRGRLALVVASIAAAVVLLGGGLAIALVDGSADQADSAATSTAISAVASATNDTVATTDTTTDATTATTEAVETTDATTSTSAPTTTTTIASTVPTTATTAATTVDSTTPIVVPTSVAPVAVPPTTRPRVTVPPTTTPEATDPPTTTTEPPTTAPPPPPGQLSIPNRVIDLGGSASSGEFSLSNTGGQSLTWSLDGSAANPFGVSAASGQLDPGQTTVVLVTLNRGSASEGAHINAVSITSSSGAGAAVELRAVVEHKPVVTITHAAKTPVCPQFEVETIVASVSDESGLSSVVLSWTGPGKAASAPMEFKGGWSAQLSVPYIEGIWTYTVTATDARGNVGTAQAATEVLCPPPG